MFLTVFLTSSAIKTELEIRTTINQSWSDRTVVPRAVCNAGMLIAAICSITEAIIASSRYLLVKMPNLKMDLVCDLQFNELKTWKKVIVANASVWAWMAFWMLKLKIAIVPIAIKALT